MYIVTSTLTVLEGTQMVGEAWTVIAEKGHTFQDINNPKVVVRVGAPGAVGVIEITDIIFSTVGPSKILSRVFGAISVGDRCFSFSSWRHRCRMEYPPAIQGLHWYVGFTYQVRPFLSCNSARR
jgi:hypothetical protein